MPLHVLLKLKGEDKHVLADRSYKVKKVLCVLLGDALTAGVCTEISSLLERTSPRREPCVNDALGMELLDARTKIHLLGTEVPGYTLECSPSHDGTGTERSDLEAPVRLIQRDTHNLRDLVREVLLGSGVSLILTQRATLEYILATQQRCAATWALQKVGVENVGILLVARLMLPDYLRIYRSLALVALNDHLASARTLL